jgi:uncharacterized RDD family membrane protein YckC
VRAADGRVLVFESRRSRKGLGPRVLDESSRSPGPDLRPLWAPGLLGWWIAVLFMGGSLLFVVGSLSGYADAVGPRGDAVTYFVGSVFFTLASYLAFRQCVSSAPELTRPASARRRWLDWRPHRIDWWSTSVQLVGTVMFNVTTFAALASDLTVQQQNRLVWAPDMLGSVCFLVASLLAWFEVCHGWWRMDRRDPGWWAAGLNLIGSIAFQISAVAAAIRPATGDEVNVTVAINGTLFGAVCFLVGAYLLLPEVRAASGTPAVPSAS